MSQRHWLKSARRGVVPAAECSFAQNIYGNKGLLFRPVHSYDKTERVIFAHRRFLWRFQACFEGKSGLRHEIWGTNFLGKNWAETIRSLRMFPFIFLPSSEEIIR